jgi:arsenite methyltransferase
MQQKNVRKIVREGYREIVKDSDRRSCCSCGSDVSSNIGYDVKELKSLPEGADLGLGCGNPVALASLKSGETVLDLGAGAGIDCFLAAKSVGKSGKVIGVDMTPEMVERARENAAKGDFGNVDFRLGEIENLPVADGTVDVVVSNCVINLSPDKKRVFEEAYRVLKKGGRLMVSDIVLLKELPAEIKRSVRAYVGCLSGAVLKNQYLRLISDAGFSDVHVVSENTFPIEMMMKDPTAVAIVKKSDLPKDKLKNLTRKVLSVRVSATKPN